jgi:hypothetical protein
MPSFTQYDPTIDARISKVERSREQLYDTNATEAICREEEAEHAGGRTERVGNDMSMVDHGKEEPAMLPKRQYFKDSARSSRFSLSMLEKPFVVISNSSVTELGDIS